MPYYTFENSNGYVWCEQMSNQEREEFLIDNPDIKQVLSNVYVGTVSNNFDWHREKGLKNTFKQLHKKWYQSASEKHQRDMKSQINPQFKNIVGEK